MFGASTAPVWTLRRSPAGSRKGSAIGSASPPASSWCRKAACRDSPTRRRASSTPDPEDAMALEVSGVDHIYVAVSDLVRSVAFYDPVMRLLGFRKGTKTIA